jgi:shikimate 5-dehydrogenase
LDNRISSIELSQLQALQPPKKTVVFLGDYAPLHAKVHETALKSLVSTYPEIAEWELLTLNSTAGELEGVIKTLHAKKVPAIVFTAPLKSPALKILSPDNEKNGEKKPVRPGELPPEKPQGFGNAEATAERVGAVNLGLRREKGYWGVSSDGVALRRLFEEMRIELKSMNIVVFGTGGFGRAAAVEALTQGCHELWIGGNTKDNALDALDQISPSFQMRARTHSFAIDSLPAKMPKTAVVINALPPETADGKNHMANLSFFNAQESIYFDSQLSSSPAYRHAQEPKWKNASLSHRFLAWQTYQHIELITGTCPDIEEIYKVVQKLV